ncbi:type II toxin-antitoxin system death-on-curing family toxin [Faunimonas sp. B44]|uniref:type II toxin-antitoxin system death-on-curing family toxin n=1 Tax=Faunimonas sp. B44 TaxID=3461493 RepID=UPI0040448A2B
MRPIWVEEEVVLAVHDAQIEEHGGRAGMRDPGLLKSALARPRNVLAYENADLAALCAAHAYGLARNHPFVDGNKRVSLVVAELFLGLNGYRLDASDAECVATWLALAEGTLDEAGLAAWIRARLSAPDAAAGG